MGHTVAVIDGDFSRKSEIFPPLVFIAPPPTEGIPLELGNTRWPQETRMESTENAGHETAGQCWMHSLYSLL